ncbi:hypothetical protein [Deinococcus sp. PEB2-63]
MEKYKVRRLFADAETGKTYTKGSTFTGRVERVSELQRSGLLEREPVPAPKGK